MTATSCLSNKYAVQHLIFWGIIASLAAALYYNTGTLWYVLVFSIVNGLRLLRLRGGQASPVFTIPALVISGMRLAINWTTLEA